MDNQERGNTSSSQSVKICEVNRRRRGRQGEELEVVLSDASSFFASLRIWEERPFHVGDLLTDEEISLIRRRSQESRAESLALGLLSGSEHSRFLLERKLLQRGVEREIVSGVLGRLEVLGALDDRRFAESWVRSRLARHPEGASHLVAGLRQRGVASDLASEVVSRLVGPDGEPMVEAAMRFAERAGRRDLDDRELAARLLHRGFSAATVREALSRLADREADHSEPSAASGEEVE